MTNTVAITLTFDEMTHAASIGAFRRIKSIANHRNPNSNNLKGVEFDRWRADIEGAMAEYAVAKWLNLPWTGSIETGDFKDADAGDNVQVRFTFHAGGGLLLYPKDRDAHLYVLTTGAYGTYQLLGWMQGSAGKVQMYLDHGKAKGLNAYLVPQSDLRPMAELAQMFSGVTA
jgi:hypothetical protein